nr:MAG TPA: hypothetical protein [Caudoviricetes sp.]
MPVPVSPSNYVEMIAALVRTPAVISFCISGRPDCKYQRLKCRFESDRNM